VRVALLVASVVALLSGCASPAPGGQATPSGGSAPSAPKRILATIIDEPVAFNGIMAFNRGGGNDAMEELLHAGAANVDGNGRLRPQLAESVPTVENGLWKLSADGQMETTWRLKAEARWQDDAPVTADDLVFTLQVGQDRELPVRGHLGYQALDRVERVDERTVTVKWRRPFIGADRLFTRDFAMPLPRHLLDRAYVDDRVNFGQLPYWSHEFVGTGPFKLKEWARGSHLVLAANDGYVLGRPRVDDIVVKFIGEPNTIVASLLSGAVELTLGRNLTLEPAIEIRDQWRDGRLELAFKSWIMMYPQLLTPNPVVVGDVQFRRALLHALDRQQMVDALQGGLVPIAHMMISPDIPEYRDSDESIMRYEYDPRRAAQIIESLGYSRGADGIHRDAAGQRLVVEARTSAGEDVFAKSLLSVADYWQRAGVAVEPNIVPRQLDQDLEYRSNFPGFALTRQPNELEALGDHRSSQAPVPETNYQGRNRARYTNVEFDGLIDRFFTTIPQAERSTIVRQIMRHITENLTMMGLFYNTEPTLVGHRLTNVFARTGEGSTHAWNAEQWDTRAVS